MKTAFNTGSDGFIGRHLAELLLQEGRTVAGYDGMTDCFDVRLSERRIQILPRHAKFTCAHAMPKDNGALQSEGSAARPDLIIHLAVQSSVGYAFESLRSCIQEGLVDAFDVRDVARNLLIQNRIMALTAPDCGSDQALTFVEPDRVDTQIIFCAASQQNFLESMAPSCAHPCEMLVTKFRVSSAYDDCGRPEMTLFKFTKCVPGGAPIDIGNLDDVWTGVAVASALMRGIKMVSIALPARIKGCGPDDPVNDLGPVAPLRIVNMVNSANSDLVRLQDVIAENEGEASSKAVGNLRPIQVGDVPPSWAPTSLFQYLTGNFPQMDFRAGVASYV